MWRDSRRACGHAAQRGGAAAHLEFGHRLAQEEQGGLRRALLEHEGCARRGPRYAHHRVPRGERLCVQCCAEARCAGRRFCGARAVVRCGNPVCLLEGSFPGCKRGGGPVRFLVRGLCSIGDAASAASGVPCWKTKRRSRGRSCGDARGSGARGGCGVC